MSNDDQTDSELEIAHVLFTDIVDYSRLPVDTQSELVRELNQVIRNTAQFRKADAAGKLIRIPTGDGVALAFFTTPDAPVRCAMEISEALGANRKVQLRMGIHSGPVDAVSDVNDRSNVAGAGINIAQRVMDCGDAGHILLSKRIADDLAQYTRWQPHLHDLGETEVKHGVHLGVVNFYGESFGNSHTPEKLTRAQKEQEDVARATASRVKQKRKLQFTGAAVLGLILSGVGFWVSQRVPHALTENAIPEKSIAVLPFDNFGDEKENAYFADGVQDDILTGLAKVADLKVISRRSVAQYRGSTKDIREIGQALQVAHVLEGSVRKFGNRIRVTAQLIDTRTEMQTWAEKYERDLANVFAIQSEVSQTIVAQLKAALAPAEKIAIETAPTQDLEAYDLYLRAKELIETVASRSNWWADATKAINFLNQAVARDPKFLQAYCLLTEIHLALFHAGFMTGDDRPARLELARICADTALHLAPDSGEAHLAQAHYFYRGLRDNERALAELDFARHKLPNNSEVFHWTGLIERRMNRWNDSLRDQLKARGLDPHDGSIMGDLASTYELLRNYEEEDRIFDHAMIALPQEANFYRMEKVRVALQRGDIAAARASLGALPADYEYNGTVAGLRADLALLSRDYAAAATLLEKVPLHPAHKAFRAALIARHLGDEAKAQSLLRTARNDFAEDLADRPEDVDVLSSLAFLDAGLGRKEDALREIKKAVELRPISRDAIDGPELACKQAEIYAWCGEGDLALKQLAVLVKIPGDPSLGDLKLKQVWDAFRKDPRFEKIVAQAAQPVKLD